MPSLVDLVGKRYGHLLVTSKTKTRIKGKTTWYCLCDCGNSKAIRGDAIIGGVVISCGCFHKEQARIQNTTHGLSRTRLYGIWHGMMMRCYNKNSNRWKYYGGKGITVCERWHTVDNFIIDVGEPPSNTHTLDRKDGNLGYFKENCKWSTPKEQANNRSNNLVLL